MQYIQKYMNNIFRYICNVCNISAYKIYLQYFSNTYANVYTIYTKICRNICRYICKNTCKNICKNMCKYKCNICKSLYNVLQFNICTSDFADGVAAGLPAGNCPAGAGSMRQADKASLTVT